MGRSHWRLSLNGDHLELLEHHAPAEFRERSAGHAIDEFIARMDRYFRLADESLGPRVVERIAVARRMDRAITQSKQEQSS